MEKKVPLPLFCDVQHPLIMAEANIILIIYSSYFLNYLVELLE